MTYFGDTWKKRNLNAIVESGIAFERLSNNAILCCGYVFDLYSGYWHKKGNGRIRHGQSAHFFLEFLRENKLVS